MTAPASVGLDATGATNSVAASSESVTRFMGAPLRVECAQPRQRLAPCRPENYVRRPGIFGCYAEVRVRDVQNYVGDVGEARPRSTAQTATCPREWRPSLFRMLATCRTAVPSA